MLPNFITPPSPFREATEVRDFLRLLGISDYMIAGGYFRDKMHGVPFKDIDVFLPGPAKALSEYDSARYSVEDSAEITFNGLLINIIRLRDKRSPQEVLRRMDIGLCQIGMTPEGTLCTTEAFELDFTNKTLTQLFPLETDGDVNHKERVRAKYPEHRYIQFGAHT